MSEQTVHERAAVGAPAQASYRRALLAWFDAHRRELPWRARRGQLPDPYAVWVSEVMLQQTQVSVVRDYFTRWMAKLPTVSALASADEAQVLSLWEGLGYYSRARRLRQGAAYVVREYGGKLPADPEELLKVPGIGPYSAGAIASIAFGKRAPLVDGNVIRVLSRSFLLAGDPTKAPLKGAIWRLAAELVPQGRPGDFNQALMELGATVCTPKKPACFQCPISRACGALKAGEVERYPELKKKPKPEQLQVVVLVACVGGRYLVTEQPSDSRWWSGMSVFPFQQIVEGQSQLSTAKALLSAHGLRLGKADWLPEFKHSITRFRIQIFPVLVTVAGGGRLSPSPGGPAAQLLHTKSLGKVAMPAPHRRIASAL